MELSKRRFLIELPTGTGQTDIVALYLKRLIQAGRAERVLFLVERDQLAKQGLEAVQDLLDQYGSYWLRPGVERQEKQITVCLLQTMIGRYEEFKSGYFDVVIADECHRSIYGAWQTSLTHFDALYIGLTATPAGYKNGIHTGFTSAKTISQTLRSASRMPSRTNTSLRIASLLASLAFLKKALSTTPNILSRQNLSGNGRIAVPTR